MPELLQLGRCNAAVNIENLMLIDSLQMTDAHRERIVTRVAVAPECHVVITHGTDTMDQTARALAKANLSKTIVLTGAMIPIKFGSTDGLFNLGSAIAFAQSLAQGVYIAMNGRYFTWDKVRTQFQRTAPLVKAAYDKLGSKPAAAEFLRTDVADLRGRPVWDMDKWANPA